MKFRNKCHEKKEEENYMYLDKTCRVNTGSGQSNP